MISGLAPRTLNLRIPGALCGRSSPRRGVAHWRGQAADHGCARVDPEGWVHRDLVATRVDLRLGWLGLRPGVHTPVVRTRSAVGLCRRTRSRDAAVGGKDPR